MKLKDLLTEVDCEIFGDEKIEIQNLSHNSKESNKNGIFFAINGDNFNGETFTDEALKNGATCVVSEKKLDVSCTNVVVKDIRKAMSLLARNYYNNPSNKMLIIGVTGTNGKTTTTYMLKKIFEEAGKKVGVIGTNGIIVDNEKLASDFTTPDPIILQKTFAEMVQNGVNVVCMETSAHALKLQKLWGVMTDIALFTNLTQDHLDFFKTMQNYFDAKFSFFTKDFSRFGVVNIDDSYGRVIYDNAEIPIVTYTKMAEFQNSADIFASNISHNFYDQEFDVKTMKGNMHVKLNMLGSFNVSNALGAIAAAIMADIDQKYILSALEKFEKVDGRFNSYWVKGVRVVIDYAHTPDGLENISVFGCGGNRDAGKRPLMGEISTKLADLTIITTDNPRTEDPMQIIKEIEYGVANSKYIIEKDRIKAIKKAVTMAGYGDTIVISGKGAEKYFDINNEKLPYITDAGVVEEMQEESFKRIQNEALIL